MERPKKVIDASIVIKWFSEEPHSDKAMKLKFDYLEKRIDFIIPDLLFYEVANVLRYNKLNERLITDSLDSIFVLNIDTKLVNKAIISNSVRKAIKYNISVYDAAYVALAELFDCELITADEKLINKKIGKISHIKDY